MAFSKTTLITRIRRLLHDNPFQDICTEAMDATEVGLDVADGTKWQVGDIVEFTDDGEKCLTTAITSNTLTVVRNFNFSVTTTAGTGTSHSISTAILKNPVFGYAETVDAIEESIQSLWPYTYKKITQTITPVSGEWYYSATATILGISSAVQLTEGTPTRPFFYGINGSMYPIQLIRNMPTAFSGSTTGSSFHIPTFNNLVKTVLVNGIGRVTDGVTSGDYDDLTDGLEVDCVTFYTASRLIATTDISRATQEDIKMSEESARVGDRSQIAAYWENQALAVRRQWERELQITLPWQYGRSQSLNRGTGRRWSQ